jgi:hypothetical protein
MPVRFGMFARLDRSRTLTLCLCCCAYCACSRSDATAMAGKWDAGMATPDHTPHGRGYQSELTYFSHCNDYWTYGIGGCLSPTPSLVTDLWDLPPGGGSEAEGPGSDMVPRCNFTDRGDWSMQKVMGESCTSAPNGDTWYGKCAPGVDPSCLSLLSCRFCPVAAATVSTLGRAQVATRTASSSSVYWM